MYPKIEYNPQDRSGKDHDRSGFGQVFQAKLFGHHHKSGDAGEGYGKQGDGDKQLLDGQAQSCLFGQTKEAADHRRKQAVDPQDLGFSSGFDFR